MMVYSGTSGTFINIDDFGVPHFWKPPNEWLSIPLWSRYDVQFGHRESMKDGKPNQGKIVWIPFSSGHKMLAFTHKHVLIYIYYINYAKDFQCRAPRCQFNRGRPYTAGSEALDPEAGAYLKIWR